MAKEYLIQFTVQCRNSISRAFPIDMLRYDHCCPASEYDSGLIHETLSEFIPITDFTPKPITLNYYSHGNRNWTPTNGRWQSFGYEVLNICTPKPIS